MRVARRQVRGGVGDRDLRAAVERVVRHAAAHPRPVDVGVAVVAGVPLRAAQGSLRAILAPARSESRRIAPYLRWPCVPTGCRPGSARCRTCRPRWPPPARSSSTSSGSASAAPTSSSSPARWPTCTTGHAVVPDAARATSGRHGHRASATASTRPGSAGGSWATRCSATAPAGAAGGGTSTSASTGRRSASAGGRPGALAEQLAVPAWSLHALPDAVDAVLGALVEPGGNALRAARGRRHSRPATGRWCSGPGRSACWRRCSLRAAGAEVHLLGVTEASLAFARDSGVRRTPGPRTPCRTCRSTPSIDASNAAHLPALALDLVEPAGRVVYIGLAGTPSPIDTRTLAAQGRHRGRHPVGLPGPGRHDRRLRERRGRPAAAGRRDRRPRPGRRRARRRAAAGGGRRARRSTSTHGSAEPNADGLTFAGTRFCRAEGEVRPKVISDDVADRGAHDVCDVGGGRVSPAEPPAARAMEPWPVDRPEPSSATTRPRVAAIDMLKVSLVSWVIGGHALLGYAAIGGAGPTTRSARRPCRGTSSWSSRWLSGRRRCL